MRVDVADVSANGDASHDDERIAVEDSWGIAALVGEMLNRYTSTRKVSVGLVVVLWLMLSTAASAHNGPPFPIIENRKVGPCVVALWTHPDVGSGAFYVFVDPAPGGSVPNDLKIQIGVQPLTGRLPEAFYEAQRVKSRGQVQYNAQASFDRQELWRVRLVVQSSQGSGEATTQVEVTPPGFGRWDLLFFLLPFLFVAFLWFRGISRVRRRRKARLDNETCRANAVKITNNAERVH